MVTKPRKIPQLRILEKLNHYRCGYWHVVKTDWAGLDRTGPGKRGLSPCFTNRGLNL